MISGGYVQEQEMAARRLVTTLEPTEYQILVCLVRGMSAKDTSAAMRIPLDAVERSTISMIKKLGARGPADALRIGLYAEVDLTS